MALLEPTPDERILAAVRDRLMEPLGGRRPTEALDRVFTWSLYPLEPAEDGAQIDIRDADEAIDTDWGYQSEGVNRHLMQLTVVVAGYGERAAEIVKAGLSQVGRLLAWDNQLGGLVERMSLDSRSIAQAEDDSHLLFGEQLWTVVYYTQVADSPSPFPPHRVLANPQAPYGRGHEDDYSDVQRLIGAES